jgi:hypothetical protein
MLNIRAEFEENKASVVEMLVKKITTINLEVPKVVA